MRLLAAALSSGLKGTAGKKEESLGRNNVKFLRVQSTETELASPSGVLYLWCRCCVMAFPLLVSEKVDVGVNLPTLRVLPGRLHECPAAAWYMDTSTALNISPEG